MTVRSPLPGKARSPVGRVLQVLGSVERVGLDPAAVLAQAATRCSLEDLRLGREEALSRETCVHICQSAAALVEAEAARRNNLPEPYAHLQFLMWYVATTSRDLSNVIGCLQAFADMTGNAVGAGMTHARGPRITLPLCRQGAISDPVNLLADFFAAVTVSNMISWLIGERLSFGQFEMAYPARFQCYLPEHFVGGEIVWDQPRLAISFPQSLMYNPVVRNQADWIALQPAAPLLMDELRQLGPFAFAVSRIFDEALATTRPFPTEEAVATRLRCSTATLRRRLAEEGASLREIKAVRRKEWAITLLRVLSIAEVTVRLGFSDETAFRRAFRQWTGQAPSSFRPQPVKARGGPIGLAPAAPARRRSQQR